MCNYADTQCCLDREFHDALKVVSSAAMNQQESQQIAALKDLIRHAWLYNSYDDLGRDKMTHEQRQLYDALISEIAVKNNQVGDHV